MTALVTLLFLLLLGAQTQHGAEWTYSGKAHPKGFVLPSALPREMMPGLSDDGVWHLLDLLPGAQHLWPGREQLTSDLG